MLLMNTLPQPREIRMRLGDAMREVELLRALLKVAERAERYRRCDEKTATMRRSRHEK